MGLIFAVVDLFPGLFGFVLANLYIRIQDVVSRLTLSQSTRGKDPPKNNPMKIKPNYKQRAHIHGTKAPQEHKVQEIQEAAPLNSTGLLPHKITAQRQGVKADKSNE